MTVTSREIEREVIDQRRDLEDTLDALQQKVSVDGMVRSLTQSLTEAGGEGETMLGNLGRQVRDNPLPAALVGVGLAWLMASKGVDADEDRHAYVAPKATAFDRERYVADLETHGVEYAVARLKAGVYTVDRQPDAVDAVAYDHARYAADVTQHGPEYGVRQLKAGAYAIKAGAKDKAATYYDRARFAKDETEKGLAKVAQSLKDGAYKVERKASDTASTVYDQARFLADEARHGAAHVSDRLVSGAYSVADGALDAMHEVGETARQNAYRAKQHGKRAQRGLVDFIAEQPIVAAALGIAAGAAIGAALPSTRVEDESLGAHRDRLRDDAMERISEEADRAERVAERSLDAAKETAREEGLLSENKTVAEKAERVVQSAKKTAKEEA